MFGTDLATIIVFMMTTFGMWYIYEKKLKIYFDKEKRKEYFAELLKDFPVVYNATTDTKKQALFQELESLQSQIPELRKEGSIRILEIGVGSGANLKYYPSNCHLVALDPNQYFVNYFMENLAKFPQIRLDKFTKSNAEDMSDLEDESFDAVVSTLVACSVNDVGKVFKEIQRVLVPGGKFLYMEHVLDRPNTLLYYVQQFLTLTHIWQTAFDGCCLNRNLDKDVEKSFSHVSQNRFYIDTSRLPVLKYIKSHVVGVATK